ncbi:type II and III secretion system protein family protein [Solirhodobacter olei]|uniref:type II and III secretion system protein family protein n=1 Tax=Solirhodobacter olei TaxID=2493082 RepID=UPI0013E2B811|nr:type II and III secretion system protein family protein [Solirhodobacter olei]
MVFLIFLGVTGGQGRAATVIGGDGAKLGLYIGQGKLIKLDNAVDNVFLANPDIADVAVKSAKYIYIYGKASGETTLYVLDSSGNVNYSATVNVSPNLSALSEAARSVVSAGRISVLNAGGALVLKGTVDTADDATKAMQVVKSLAGKNAVVVDNLQLITPAQVNLQVRIAEVSRTVGNELGVSLNGTGSGGLNSDGQFSGSFSLTGSVLKGNAKLNYMIDTLAKEGLITILSEPNLTARSGDTASFLAGGRFPYQTGGTATTASSVVFEPYGVELKFTPVVVRPNQISLAVNTSIRELDFSNGSKTQTQSVPLILERSASTTVEVGSGQSFAIAGLFDTKTQQDVAKLPGLGSLPVLGALFRSTEFQKGESELVVVVTPYIVHPVSPGQVKTPVDKFKASSFVGRAFLGQLSADVPEGKTGVSVRALNGAAGAMLQ